MNEQTNKNPSNNQDTSLHLNILADISHDAPLSYTSDCFDMIFIVMTAMTNFQATNTENMTNAFNVAAR